MWLFWRLVWVPILLAAAVGGAVYGWSSTRPDRYRAEATLGAVPANGLSARAQRDRWVELLRNGGTRDLTSTETGSGPTVRVDTLDPGNLLRISVVSESATDAADTLDTVVVGAVAASLDDRIGPLQDELDVLEAQRADLEDRITTADDDIEVLTTRIEAAPERDLDLEDQRSEMIQRRNGLISTLNGIDRQLTSLRADLQTADPVLEVLGSPTDPPPLDGPFPVRDATVAALTALVTGLVLLAAASRESARRRALRPRRRRRR